MFIVIGIKKAILLSGSLILLGVGYAKVKHRLERIEASNRIRMMNELYRLKQKPSNVHEIFKKKEA